MILINPPITKICEPPAGLAGLAGNLKRHGVSFRLMDFNLTGMLGLLQAPSQSEDVWTSRAVRHLPRNLSFLTRAEAYGNIARYITAVKEINRIIEKSVSSPHIRLSLTDYEDDSLLPVRSRDLINASEHPEKNPFYPYFSEELPAALEEEGSNIVGFSLNYFSQALTTFAMLGFLRKTYSGIRLILGGGLVTSWMSKPDWRNPFEGVVHEMVAGPGEQALLSLHGVAIQDITAAPDYDAFLHGGYLAPGFILPYSSSSGCYWRRCSFCPETAEGNPYRPVPLPQVSRDLSVLCSETKPVLIHFLDNAMSPSLLRTIADHPLKMPWYGFARITDHLADSEFCAALKRSGCVMLQLGLESGDQGILDGLKKGINLDLASLTLKSLKGAGIGTYVYLLFGTPDETISEARRTLEFTLRHAHLIDFLNVAIFNMPAYGPDVGKVKTAEFYEGDLSLYKNFIHPHGWNRPRIRKFLDREFKRHAVISSIMKRNPPFFTSNHAAFFV